MANGPAAPQIAEVYAVFAGDINQAAVQRIFHGLAAVSGAAGARHVHLLFQSYGGGVGDGVCLYNFFRGAPIDITLYNVGVVHSIAAIAYLGAKRRKVSTYANFMLHRTQASPIAATATRLQTIAQSVAMDDARTEAILKKHLDLSDEQWDAHRVSDLWFTAEEAVRCKLADEIGEFAPPLGQQVFNV